MSRASFYKSRPAFFPAKRRSHRSEEALHPSGDGQSPDGEEPVQREADGAAGGRQMDRDDPVREGGAKKRELRFKHIAFHLK